MTDPTRRDFLGGAFGAAIGGIVPVQATAKEPTGRHRISQGNGVIHLDVEIPGKDPSPAANDLARDFSKKLKERGIDVTSAHTGHDAWVRNKTAEVGNQRRDLGTLDYAGDDPIEYKAREGLRNVFNKGPVTEEERLKAATALGYDPEKRRVISISIDPKGRDPKQVMQDVDTAYRDMTGQTAPGYTPPLHGQKP